MIETFVKRKVTTSMFILFLTILGIVSFNSINIEKTPRIELPFVTVSITYPGATPIEVEQDVIKDIEDVIIEISEIKKLTSDAYEGLGVISIEFNLGVDPNIKAMEVKDKVESILNDLPKAIEKPIIEKKNPFADPIIELTLESQNHDGKFLYNFADKIIKPELYKITGVSTIDITGGREREIHIDVDSELLRQKGMSITNLFQAIETYNVNIPGGKIKRAGNEMNVRFIGEYQSVSEIADMLITTDEGNSFLLKEIAAVSDSTKTLEKNALYNSKETVVLGIKKTTDGNDVVISTEFKKLYPKVQSLLESGMTTAVTTDTTVSVIRDTDGTVSSIFVGILLTMLVLIVFTANISTTFITAIVIPITIMSTFFMIDSANFTINAMTLLALATVLGTLIANAIIIIDSSLLYLAKGSSPDEAAVKGTMDSIIPVIASSGTNLAVFIPIGFMGGIVGQFMKQFGLTVVFATILSIIISFTLCPMLISKMLTVKKQEGKDNILKRSSDAINQYIINKYRIIFELLFKFKKTALLLSLMFLISTTFLLKYIGSEFMPMSDNDKIKVELKTPQGSSLATTQAYAKIISDRALKMPYAESTLTIIGNNGLENASVAVNLTNSSKRKISDLDFISNLIPLISDIPDIESEIIRVSSTENTNADLMIEVFGYDYDQMAKDANHIISEMHTLKAFRSVYSNYKEPANEYKFIPNQTQLDRFGISNQQIASTLRCSLYGNDSSVFKSNGESYDILLSVSDNFKETKDAFDSIFVSSKQGLIPLSNLGSIELSKAYSPIKRIGRKRIIEIKGFLGKSTTGKIQQAIDKKLKNYKFEKGHGYNYSGNSELQDETMAEISKAFILAVIFTYMVLAATMNSLIHPFTIALSILTSFSGVFILLFFTDISINIASMLAVIMLVGLVVNPAILLLENTVKKMKEEGKDIKTALIESSELKIKTILMTSIAIVLGTLPQMFTIDLLKISMGSVIIGGILASIFSSLIIIPLVFYYIETASTNLKVLLNRKKVE